MFFIIIGFAVLIASFVIAVVSLVKEQKAAEKNFEEKEEAGAVPIRTELDSALATEKELHNSLNAQVYDLTTTQKEPTTEEQKREPFPWEQAEGRESAIAQLAAKVKEAETLQGQTDELGNEEDDEAVEEPHLPLDGQLPAHMGEHEALSDAQNVDFSAPSSNRFAKFDDNNEEPSAFTGQTKSVGVIDVQGLANAKKNEG